MGEPWRGRACPVQLAVVAMQARTAESAGSYDYPLAAQRNLILAALLGLAAVAWLVLVFQWAAADDDEGMGLRMDMGPRAFHGGLGSDDGRHDVPHGGADDLSVWPDPGEQAGA